MVVMILFQIKKKPYLLSSTQKSTLNTLRTRNGELPDFVLFYIDIISSSELYRFPGLILDNKKRKSSEKQIVLVQLLFKSGNISRATFRGGACSNVNPEKCRDFVHFNMSNDDPFSNKTNSSGNETEEIQFSRETQHFLRFDNN